MIAGISYYHILQYFLIYSFIGWCVEVIYQAVSKGVIVNRGFLNGPVCPIYGFGVLAVFAAVNTAEAYAEPGSGKAGFLLVFLCGAALTTSIELFGGWALDKIFHARWWDYSDKPFNFHGYICLEFSLLWGLGIVIIVEVIQPIIASMADRSIPESICLPLMGVLYTAYAADFMLSVMIMVGLNKRRAERDEMQKKRRVVSNKLSSEIGKGALETAQHVGEAKVQAALATAKAKDSLNAVKAEAAESLGAAKAEAIGGLTTVTAEAIGSLNAAKAEAKESLGAAKSGIRAGIADMHSSGERQAARIRERYERKKAALSRMIRSTRYFGTGRLLRAFPQMQHRKYRELLEALKKDAEEGEDRK